MRETFCIRFYCRPAARRKDGRAPVEVSVIVSGERQLWQLPRKCRPEDFENDQDIKDYCKAIEGRLNKIHNYLVYNEEPVTAYRIKDMYFNGNAAKSYTLATLFDDGLKIKAEENHTVGTYNKYKLIREKFFKWTGLSEKQEADKCTATDIIQFRIEAEKQHVPQTVSKEMKNLKYFFNLAFNSGKIRRNPFASIKISAAEKDQSYLEYSEIRQIKNCIITNDRLDKVRDVFLFLCFTGLEWADLIHLNKNDVQKNQDGQYFIRKPRIKTGIEYLSILHEDAVKLWDFYDGQLPLVSPQKFNMYLKELAEIAGIEKKVTSLTARHTYACYLLNYKQVSIETVAKMLGHKTTNQTRRYAKMFGATVFEQNKTAQKPRQPHRTTYMEYLEDKQAMEFFSQMLGV